MISSDVIKDTVVETYRRALCDIRPEVEDALKRAYDKEETEAAKGALKIMLDAIQQAREQQRVLCGDTGLVNYHVTVGSELKVPKDLTETIQAGAEEAIKEIPMRHPCTRPVDPVTFKDMKAPILNYHFHPGADYIEIVAFPKGTGSSPYSNADVLSADLKLIKKYILDMVSLAGPRACPPYVVGVGIGGVLETSTMAAAEAIARPINERNSDPEIAKLEEEMLEAVNDLGYGPMGVGGKTTAIAVNIETRGSCGAPIMPGFGWIPAAVIINCYPGRWGKARIYEDNRVEYL
jgi:tartrate/fumarate subfamily iron-sulfur-dependent hydro-lyase alpha chain